MSKTSLAAKVSPASRPLSEPWSDTEECEQNAPKRSMFTSGIPDRYRSRRPAANVSKQLFTYGCQAGCPCEGLDELGAQIADDDCSGVIAPLLQPSGIGQILLEHGGKRVSVGKVNVADAENGDVELDRIHALAEDAGAFAPTQEVPQGFHKMKGKCRHQLGWPKIPAMERVFVNHNAPNPGIV